MAIKKTLHNKSQVGRQSIQAGRRPVHASTGVTSGARRRGAKNSQTSVLASQAFRALSPEKQNFARQLQSTARKMSVMGATNTNNIAAKPEFVELLPLFVQKLLILDVFGSVAMNSRQQLVPYFKVKAENTKGETAKGTIFSSPFVNAQGVDPNFTGRLIRNEAVAANTLAYVPVLPGSVAIDETNNGTTVKYVDNGNGGFVDAAGQAVAGYSIDYATGVITGPTGTVSATYQYDNEFVGPNADGKYGASMGKFDLQLDEINLIAEAHEVASYWSIYSAFAAQQEYGANIADMSKEAAFGQLTAEINSKGFETLAKAAEYKPQFNWDAAPVLSGAVMPSDYLNMFKLKLEQAASSIYQATRLSQPNRLIVGTTTAAYIKMINGFQAENTTDNVGPYKLGALDNFDIYVDPNYDPNTWVMACKSQDIRRNSALYGEYMPFTETAPIGLADMSVQSGFATMYAMEVVNPNTIVSGKILGQF